MDRGYKLPANLSIYFTFYVNWVVTVSSVVDHQHFFIGETNACLDFTSQLKRRENKERENERMSKNNGSKKRITVFSFGCRSTCRLAIRFVGPDPILFPSAMH